MTVYPTEAVVADLSTALPTKPTFGEKDEATLISKN
jgi:hypothetical protein